MTISVDDPLEHEAKKRKTNELKIAGNRLFIYRFQLKPLLRTPACYCNCTIRKYSLASNLYMQRWNLRNVRIIVYAATLFSFFAITASCFMDGGSKAEILIGMRQLFGLWALGFLLAAMLIGPLTTVLPWIPLKAHLVLARRAIGVSAFMFAIVHVLCYVLPILPWNWRQFYTPGPLWVAGLILGTVAFVCMALLAYTSRDKSVVKLGGKKWKRLHQLTYALLPTVLIHAVCVGSDFGINRGPDVKNEPDAGALIGFLSVAAIWLGLFIWRRRQLNKSTNARNIKIS